MSDRTRLPARRVHECFEVEHAGQRFSVGLGRYGDGSLGEVFVSAMVKSAKGSAIEALARDAAILISIARQYGAGVEEMRGAVTRGDDGRPATLVGAVLDALGEG